MQPRKLSQQADSRYSLDRMVQGAAPAISEEAARAERLVLGAALLDPIACAQAVEHLRPEHFGDVRGRHAEMFRFIVDLFRRDLPVNAFSLADAGFDLTYLSGLVSDVGTTANTVAHAMKVRSAYMARESERVMRQAIGVLTEGSTEVQDVISDVQAQLSGLSLGTFEGTHISEAVQEARRRVQEWYNGEATDYVPTGFYSLDEKIGGYPIGELTTLAAHTGAGKTSLLVQIVRTLALIEANKVKPRALLIFSAEMSREQIVHRAASALAGVNIRALRARMASDHDYVRYEQALARLSGLPIHIDQTPSPTFAHIGARCQQLAQTQGLAFVGVDYDEKIHTEGPTEELRVSAIAQGLKNLAKRFAVAVVALSQYSREAQKEYGMPSDRFLRYSGKKEHESAVILHWYYPGYWVDKGVNPGSVPDYDPHDPRRGWLLCTKNRFGATGKASLLFEPEYTRFIDTNEPKETPF